MKLALVLLLVCGVYSQACTFKALENWSGTWVKTDSQGNQCGYAFKANASTPARTLYLSSSTNGTVNSVAFDLVVTQTKTLFKSGRNAVGCQDLTNFVVRLVGNCSDDKIDVVDTDGNRLIGNKFGDEVLLLGRQSSFNLWKS